MKIDYLHATVSSIWLWISSPWMPKKHLTGPLFASLTRGMLTPQKPSAKPLPKYLYFGFFDSHASENDCARGSPGISNLERNFKQKQMVSNYWVHTRFFHIFIGLWFPFISFFLNITNWKLWWLNIKYVWTPDAGFKIHLI